MAPVCLNGVLGCVLLLFASLNWLSTKLDRWQRHQSVRLRERVKSAKSILEPTNLVRFIYIYGLFAAEVWEHMKFSNLHEVRYYGYRIGHNVRCYVQETVGLSRNYCHVKRKIIACYYPTQWQRVGCTITSINWMLMSVVK